MKCICNRIFTVNADLHVVVGLRWIEEESNFLPKIGILMGREKVVLDPEDWSAIKGLQRVFRQFFETGIFGDLNAKTLSSFRSFEILFTKGGKREIVIKCTSTFNTVRINSGCFDRILEFQPCIDQRLEIAKSFSARYSEMKDELVIFMSEKFATETEEMMILQKRLSELGIGHVPPPPKISAAEIFSALSKEMGVKNGLMTELVCTYSDLLIQQISTKVNVEMRRLYSEIYSGKEPSQK